MYRAGRDNGNADGMFRQPDMRELCIGYKTGIKINELSYGCCQLCVWLQDTCGKYEAEVDNVAPLAVEEISLEPGGWVNNYNKRS